MLTKEKITVGDGFRFGFGFAVANLLKGLYNRKNIQMWTIVWKEESCVRLCYQYMSQDYQHTVLTVSECMITSSAFWNINTDLSEVRKECEASINSQRLNCKMDCYIEHNMPKDPERERAIEFWDRAVKNFPDERVD